MAERFIRAAKDGYMDILREATKKDLNTPDEDGMTATHWAAYHGNLEALRLIVGREGNVDRADYQGMTAIHHAAMRGHVGVVSYLVNWGCNLYALDNDFHSALDLAAMSDRHEIVKYLDMHLAEKQAKNPKQASRLKEEAVKNAEVNIKRYEKLTDSAAKKAEKEHRKMQLKVDQLLNNPSDELDPSSKANKGFFQTLTLRIKGLPSVNNKQTNNNKPYSAGRRKSSVFSDAVSLSYSDGRNRVSKNTLMRRLDSVTRAMADADLENKGGVSGGFVGLSSEVIYVAGAKLSSQGAGGTLSRAKSESELLDSGTDTYYDGEEEVDDDEDNNKTPKTEFGIFSFLAKNPLVETLQSLDGNGLSFNPEDVMGGLKHQTDMRSEAIQTARGQSLPWDQEDLGNLDDDDNDNEDKDSELSAVNMFLWSCGLASYMHIFSKEKIDMSVLVEMTEDELKELGLKEFGPRKKLRDAIAKRRAALQTPSHMTDTHL